MMLLIFMFYVEYFRVYGVVSGLLVLLVLVLCVCVTPSASSFLCQSITWNIDRAQQQSNRFVYFFIFIFFSTDFCAFVCCFWCLHHKSYWHFKSVHESTFNDRHEVQNTKHHRTLIQLRFFFVCVCIEYQMILWEQDPITSHS